MAAEIVLVLGLDESLLGYKTILQNIPSSTANELECGRWEPARA